MYTCTRKVLSVPLGVAFVSFDAEVAAAKEAFQNIPLLDPETTILFGKLETRRKNRGELSDEPSRRGICIIALWVPAHCGIPESEVAGELASVASKKPFLNHMAVPPAFKTVKTLTKRKQTSKLLCISKIDPEQTLYIY